MSACELCPRRCGVDRSAVRGFCGAGAALAAARALYQNTDLSAAEIADKALHIASEICVYTNDHIIVETV